MSAVRNKLTPSPPTSLRFTLEKLRESVVSEGEVTESEFAEALDALENPAVTVLTPMTVAAWGRSSLTSGCAGARRFREPRRPDLYQTRSRLRRQPSPVLAVLRYLKQRAAFSIRPIGAVRGSP